eukprot:CAMPEP_0195109832 /NCGR_PEP_ID=MMETSP0448-20130528/90659_1 /TAXON_ID=66468 /ORGANISM="Heterocapsa triquestra, Strain CCMP 448" /LENGTH=42 /DNA_ID= /DNA_START= /DNA_END= /DNA_ORIENTATION=
MMSDWAVYVKVTAPCGEPFVGILQQEEFGDGFGDEAVRGGRV